MDGQYSVGSIPKQSTYSEILERQEAELIDRLNKVRAARDILEKNPEFKKLLDTLSQLNILRY